MGTVHTLVSYFREDDIELKPFYPEFILPTEVHLPLGYFEGRTERMIASGDFNALCFFIMKDRKQVGLASIETDALPCGSVRVSVYADKSYGDFMHRALRILLKYIFEVLKFDRAVTSAADYESAHIANILRHGFSEYERCIVDGEPGFTSHEAIHYELMQKQWRGETTLTIQ